MYMCVCMYIYIYIYIFTSPLYPCIPVRFFLHFVNEGGQKILVCKMRNTWECEHAASRSTHRDILMPGDGGPTVELKGATRNSGSHAIAKHTNKMNPIHQVVTCLKAPTTVQWPDQAEISGGEGCGIYAV